MSHNTYSIMYLLKLLSFLVIALPSCFVAGDNRGIVLSFAPSGDFSYIFSKQEKQDDLVNNWVELNGNKIVRINCMKIELNAKTDRVISHYRTNILTVDNTELESFKVTECDESKLLNSIKVSVLRNEINRKNYQITFKDTENNCRQRDYQVDFTSNKADSLVAVTRQPVVTIKYGYRSKCVIPKEVEGVVSEWYDDGKFHDLDVYEKYDTTLALGGKKCDDCWILCKETTKTEIEKGNTNGDNKESQTQDQKVFFVDLVIKGTPVDRIKVASCTTLSLITSITFDFTGQADDRYKSYYIKFLKSDGVCYYRSYNIDVQYHKEIMFKYVFLKRKAEMMKRDCLTMKAGGLARSAVKKVTRHFGRVTNPNVSLQRQDDNDEAK